MVGVKRDQMMSLDNIVQRYYRWQGESGQGLLEFKAMQAWYHLPINPRVVIVFTLYSLGVISPSSQIITRSLISTYECLVLA